MNTIADVEQRLAIEQRFLEAARIVNNPIATALAQAHIRALEHELFRLRLIDEGGWDGLKLRGERGRDYDMSGL